MNDIVALEPVTLPDPSTPVAGMSFRINVKGLKEGILPANIVATTGVVKENKMAGHIALVATAECLYAVANGGRVSVKNPIPFMTTYCTDYQFKSAGSVTVNAGDLVKVLDSFSPTEILSISLSSGTNGQELSIRPESDPEQVQTLPLHGVAIETIARPAKISKSVTLSRSLFVSSVERTIFAGGEEQQQPRYLYWVLRTDKGMVRFAAGSGVMFAILTLRGETIGLNKDELLIPVEPTQVILKVLKGATGEDVTISQSIAEIEDNKDEKKKFDANRYVIECGDLCIVVAGFDPSIKWVDEDSILNRRNHYRFTVPIKDLTLAIKGIEATNNSDAAEINKKTNKIHATTIDLDCNKKVCQLNSVGTMKAVRKINLADVVSNAEEHTMNIRCPTKALIEVMKSLGRSDFLQFELVNGDKPLVIRFDAQKTVSNTRTSAVTPLGLEEEFVMFVGRLNPR